MKLWRLHIRSARADARQSFAYCLDNHLIGTGWAVDGLSERTTNRERYVAAATKQYANGRSWRSWRSSVLPFIDEVVPGDLIWTLSPKGEFYLAVVPEDGGHWEYSPAAEALAVDVVNIRHVRLYRVGLVDAVPRNSSKCFYR
jgi:hypothetical protein